MVIYTLKKTQIVSMKCQTELGIYSLQDIWFMESFVLEVWRLQL
jgi:hypothetical protein